MENPVDIDTLDAEVVREFGWTSASTLEEIYTQFIRSYINLILDDNGFCGYADPYSCDEMRRNYHNTIAAAWHIPRKLVSIALESIIGKDGQRTNCFNLYVKTKDTSLVVRRFLDRLAEIRHEFYIDGKHWEYVDKVGNTWVEKGEYKPNLDSKINLDGIPDMHQ